MSLDIPRSGAEAELLAHLVRPHVLVHDQLEDVVSVLGHHHLLSVIIVIIIIILTSHSMSRGLGSMAQISLRASATCAGEVPYVVLRRVTILMTQLN